MAHARLKFLDESGVTTILTRRYGHALGVERVVEAVPKNYGPVTSLLQYDQFNGVETTMVVEAAVDTVCFDAFCENFLRPCLQPGDIVVLDNLRAHHASRIEQIVQDQQARVIWLPPYSPDLSPIELMWSKLKTCLRKAKARTNHDLDQAIAQALHFITKQDCRAWFKHCGYQVA